MAHVGPPSERYKFSAQPMFLSPGNPAANGCSQVIVNVLPFETCSPPFGERICTAGTRMVAGEELGLGDAEAATFDDVDGADEDKGCADDCEVLFRIYTIPAAETNTIIAKTMTHKDRNPFCWFVAMFYSIAYAKTPHEGASLPRS